MTLERRHDIDWLRVIAIGLLLIYHIAIIFQPWALFIGFIRSDEQVENLWIPMTMLNVWRIPFLFYVSGMGVFFALAKRNFWQLIAERTRRILIPLLFGIVAITPLHLLIFQKYYHLTPTYHPHAGHLWFLGNIFIYVLLLSPLFTYLMRNQDGTFKKKLSVMMKNPLGPLAITVFFILEAVLVKPQIFTLYAQTLHGFVLGCLAFFFGFLFVYSGKVFWETISKWKWLYAGLAAVLFTVRLLVFNTSSPGYLIAIESNLWIFSIMGFGYQYLNKPSKVLSYLSQAAYPVYIIHMFVMYAGAVIFLPLNIPPMFKFTLITTFTFVVCYIIYEFIVRRIGLLKPLFGLKWQFANAKKPEISVKESVQ